MEYGGRKGVCSTVGRKTRPVGESRIMENVGLDRGEDIESAQNQQDGRQMHAENEVYHRTM